MLKNFNKSFIILPTVTLILIILFYVGIYIWFGYTSKWKYNVECFETYRNDFEKVAEFCQDYIRQNEDLEEERLIFVYNFSKKELLCNRQSIKTSEEVKKSFENVKKAFPNKDAKFDSITCDGGKVFFETHNGLYSVVYSKEEKPQFVDTVHQGVSKKIDDNWYHVVKK